MGFRVMDEGFLCRGFMVRVLGPGFRFRVGFSGSGFHGSGFWVLGFGLALMVAGSGLLSRVFEFRVWCFEFVFFRFRV